MGLLDKISKNVSVDRRCPKGNWHKVTEENPDCGCTGVVLEWCEPYQRWIPNPNKTAVAKEQMEKDEEFKVDQEARLRLEEAIAKGKLKPTPDLSKMRRR